MNIKGSLPVLILHRLSQGPGHGYQIAKEIREKSAGVLDFAEGTLYPTLHRLEGEGLVSSFERLENGRNRRYYELTSRGKKALVQEKAAWQRYTDVVSQILGESDERLEQPA